MSQLFYDYAVFGLLIIATFAFNVYNNVSGPKEKTKADYVFASGRSASTWAMLLSIARGFLGVRVFLGFPSELFYRGAAMWETVYGMCLAFPVVAYFFVPVYYSLGVTSVYQYLDLRFKSRLVRCLASAAYIARQTLSLGVTVFTPCVALKTIIGMPYWMSIVGISSIGICCTLMGGLRAAIMIDVIQGIAMILCSIFVIIQGSITAKGGPSSVISIPYERGRLDFFNFDLNPTLRVTTVSALLGQFFMTLSLYGCQQNFVQRYLSMKSQGKVIKTLWLNVPFTLLLISLSWIVGMVIFTHYADCDPKKLGYISDIDEILPFYIEDKFVFLPGFLGLTMACLFNGALSFLVSNLNSISTVIFEDFLSHLSMCKNLTEKKQLKAIKWIGLGVGISIMGISFVVSLFSGVIESSMMTTSATSGPLLGVFILAMFVPIANWKGASAGMIVSYCITAWLAIGSAFVDKSPVKYLPTSIDECTNDTFSNHIAPGYLLNTMHSRSASSAIYNESAETIFTEDYSTDSLIEEDRELKVVPAKTDDFLTYLFRITYMYYALLGTFMTVVLGTVVSYFTGNDEDYEYSEILLHPLVKKARAWLKNNRNCYESETKLKKMSKDMVSEKMDFPTVKVQSLSEKPPRVASYTNPAFVNELNNFQKQQQC